MRSKQTIFTTGMIRALVWGVAFVISSSCFADIEAKLFPSKGPYYVGMPISFQLRIASSDISERPKVTVQSEAEGLSWEQTETGVSRTRSITPSGTVEYAVFDVNFEFTAASAGEYEIGPFEVQVGSDRRRVESARFAFIDIPTTDDMRFVATVPDGPFYPTQRVPVTMQWWIRGVIDINEIVEFVATAEVLDTFDYELKELSSKDAILPVQTKEGSIDIQWTRSGEQFNGKTYTVYTATPTVIPDRIGSFELAPPEVFIKQKVGGRRRNNFLDPFEALGMSRASREVRAYKATGNLVKIEVVDFPRQGRPPSFAGAVGKGYSLTVQADRTVVRTGDPIGLNITLRGDGNLQGTGLPNLAASGFEEKGFRIPNADPAGELSEGEKRFSVNVRVEGDSVQEIPPIAFSWFDIASHTYKTTYSDPIALRVMPATIVSATDVVSGSPKAGGEDVPDSPASQTNQSSVVAGPLASAGADLAIEPNPALLLMVRSPAAISGVVQTSAYTLGIIALVVALLDRRRRAEDPVVAQQRKNAREQLSAIGKARELSPREAAGQISEALRSLVVDQPDFRRDATQRLIGQMEALVYQPVGDSREPIDPKYVAEATELAEAFLKELQ